MYDSDFPNLAEQLERLGMEKESEEFLVTYDLSNLKFAPPKSMGEIRRVNNEIDLLDLNELFSVVWDSTHPGVRDIVKKAVSSNSKSIEVFAYYLNGKAISAG